MVALSALMATALAVTSPNVEVVKFTSQYCAPCRAMEPAIQQVQAQGYRVSTVDIDQRPDLAQRYAVQSVPTLLIVADGKIVDRLQGLTSAEVIIARITQATSAGMAKRGNGAVPGRLLPNSNAATSSMSVSATARNELPERRFEPEATQPGGTSSVEELARQATVQLQVEDAQGKSCGTGTVVDVHAASPNEWEILILTCGHIFRDSQGRGSIEAISFSPKAQGSFRAQVLHFDLDRDVALVTAKVGFRIDPVRVAGKKYQVTPGQQLFSVGCDHGQSASIMRGELKAINKYLGPDNLVVSGRPVDGRSGGGLFSYDGLLVGVCNAADPELNEGLYAAYPSIHRHLDKANLAFIYQAGDPPAAVAQASFDASPAGAAGGRNANGPARDQLVGGLSGAGLTPIDATRQPMSDDFANQAASFAEFASAGAEVICIVRPKDQPSSKSQVIVLDRPSRDFINQLTAEQSQQAVRRMTQMREERSGPNREISRKESQPSAASSSRATQRRHTDIRRVPTRP